MNLTIGLIVIGFTLISSAFFSGIETGVISISKIKLLKKLKAGNKGAKIINDLILKSEKLLGTTLVGTNISIVIASTILTGIIYEHSPDYAQYLSFLILTPIILLVCEAIPKAVFREYRNSLTLKLALVLQVSFIIFYPIVILVSFISNLLIVVLGGKKVDKSPYITREELKIITVESYRGEEDEGLRKIARRIFYFGEKTAGNIMLELEDLAMFEKTQTIGELKEKFKQGKFSKYPVYSRKPENMVGFVYVRDILAVGDNKRISGYIREADTVDKDTGLEELLTHFKRGAAQLVFVADGEKILGMITMEDVLEELFGDIKDEYDVS